MTQHEALVHYQDLVDRSGVAQKVEALLAVGVRPRQLSVRTLLLGVLLTLADGRPAQLNRVHQALCGLDRSDRLRLGVLVEWKAGWHQLSYRQVERTFHLVVVALSKHEADGRPAAVLQEVVRALVEASVPEAVSEMTSSYAVDWTDVESFSTRRTKPSGHYADPEASWGHRKGGGPGEQDELFFGYYLQLATMVADDHGPPVPELVASMLLTSCHVDPPEAFAGVLAAMADHGVSINEVLCDSGYAHRVPEHWALPLRASGIDLVMDLHPHDRGTKGTHEGAVAWNGNLYCPATPKALFDLEPLARHASAADTEDHDRRAAEVDRYRLGTVARPDAEGYHRAGCPARLGKLRCPLVEGSMALGYDRPEILSPPEHPPTCCDQVTITVPPSVNAKTAQKHPYPSKAHRRSYARRSAAERSNATIKDPARNDVARGWCRTMGLVPMTLMLACLMVVRNDRIVVAFQARRCEEERRAARGLPPKTRRRRRTTIADLVGNANAPPSPGNA